MSFRCRLWWIIPVFLLYVLGQTNRNVFSHQSLKEQIVKNPTEAHSSYAERQKKLIRTLSFSKSRPCSSHEPSCSMHNDERRGKKIMNWVLPIKTLISPNCVAVWLSACLLICHLSANWITFKAHQVQFALSLERQQCSSSCVNNTGARFKTKCIVCLPFMTHADWIWVRFSRAQFKSGRKMKIVAQSQL